MAMVQSDKPQILIVDDEPAVLVLLRRILSSKDADILTVRTGAQALNIARRAPLDLVILAVRLPDLSGLEVLKRLRRIHEFVPVIMVASRGSKETVRASMRFGAVDYLTKPFDNEEVKRAAHEALTNRALRLMPSEAC